VHFKNEDLFNLFQKAKTKCLVGESETTHTRLDAEDVVVGREHVEVGRGTRGRGGDGNLRVVDAGEVAGAGGLVLLGLEREGVSVNTGEGAAGVVLEGLDLVEILAVLRLEAVLAVENKLELGHRTLGLLGPGLAVVVATSGHNGGTGRGRDGKVESTGGGVARGAGSEGDRVRDTGGLTEVPETIGTRTSEAPHELLDGVVVGEADLLGAGGINSVNTGVLHLLNQVFVTLLGEAATLLGVEVDVVSPHLEHTLVEVGLHVPSEVEIDADLVVLERDEGEVETGVAVEEEHEGEEDGLAILGGGELTVSGLLGLIEVKLGVEAPPLLVLLVYTLTTDGKLDGGDRTLGDPASSRGASSGFGLKLDIHVTDEITVAGDSHGNAARVAGVTIESLLDVLHREVGVALVFRLVKGYLRVTSEVDILGAVSYELHKTTGHFESFCTIYGENNSATFRDQIFLGLSKMSIRPEDLEEGEIIPEDEIDEIETITDDDDEELMEVDEEEEDEDEELDVVTLMTSLLATEDGDTVCTALITIAQQLQTQNKILIKILSKL